MKKRVHGPSLYYATDKNVFEALNQHKVDTPTVMKLFQRRNIIVGKKTPREDLAKYFSRLTHDYYDHKGIAARLGIAPRRERITSMDVTGVSEIEELQAAVDQLKQELEAGGDVVHVSRDGDNLTMHVQYSTVDYKRSEFTQVQVRDGTVEFVKSPDGFIVRNTQNEYLNDVRETLLGKIEKAVETSLTKVVVSLFDVMSPKLRSKFFHELATNLPGYVRRDVTDVYVYKAKPEPEDESDNSVTDDPDTHVERVFLRGNGVTRSELLNGLLDEDDYYITKIGWTATENMGNGNVYDIEAVFADPKECTGFSFILSGVFPMEQGKVSARRRAPHKFEVDAISRVIEAKSRELMTRLREEFAGLSTGDA
ncbi:hypothetical protein [Pseudogulbenkiania ferrooxidans]|uniref:Uncharacterized protein n=1 Tax=Pseudogulbenkiania ferrooxidans 2002 TaxID=279714 RepID=B9Z8V3_9NEIS|nr:hypothetical protein [Pseudogulbenkiania ferrooxidans]EEG06772.1 conserved hypothetical protein [Pseudogulbenkiania ferrooxidans 2002]